MPVSGLCKYSFVLLAFYFNIQMQICMNSHGKFEYTKSEQAFLLLLLFYWKFFLSLKIYSKCIKDTEKHQQQKNQPINQKNPPNSDNQVYLCEC